MNKKLILVNELAKFCLFCWQLRIFVNQLHISQREVRWLNKDLLAIRMASVNPILDPWIYILLRKTVVLKLMEKIKCLFCKMEGRGRGRGGQFRCTDGHLSCSIISHDCPSLVSRDLQELVCSSRTSLYPTEGNPGRSSQAGPQFTRSQTLQGPQEDEAPHRGLSQSNSDDAVPGRLPVCPKDSTLHVTFTKELTNTQEKCI